MKKKEAAPLLELLDQRWRDTIQHMPDPTPERPAKRPDYQLPLETLKGYARDHAEANNSDPFAARTALHYMHRGYWLASDVREDARSRTSARRAQGVTFPAVKVAA